MPDPRWKTVACPKCGSGAGQSCFRRRLGAPRQLVRVAPHAARRLKAAQVASLDAQARDDFDLR